MAQNPEIRPRFGRRLLAALAGLFGLAVLIVVCWWMPHPARVRIGASEPLVLIGFSSDGQSLVTVRRQPEKQAPGDNPFVEAVGRWIFPRHSAPIQVWDVHAGTERFRFEGAGTTIMRLALAPKGGLLASEDDRGDLKLWDLKTGAERASLKAQTIGTYDTQTFWFSPDGRTLAYRTADDDIKLWDTEKGAERATLRGKAWSVAFSPTARPSRCRSSPRGART